MSEIEGLPEPWQRLFRNAQIRSQNELAEKAHVSTATVNRIIRTGATSKSTVDALARVLTEGDTDPIWAATGTTVRDYGEFPIARIADDLELLTPNQRKALIALVRSMAHPDSKGGEEHVSSAPTNDGPPSPNDLGAARTRREQMIADATTEQRAARKDSPSSKAAAEHRQRLSEVGEESQDPGGDEPA